MAAKSLRRPRTWSSARPILTVRGGAPSTVRLVRVSKAPVSGEETYRLLIDEIPDRKNLQAGTVALARPSKSAGVFSPETMRTPAQLAWKAVERKGKLVIEASNTGQRRVKLSKLSVIDENNHDLVKNGGLAYVLGGQTKAWELSGAAAGKTLTIKAESDTGPVNASAIAGRSG